MHRLWRVTLGRNTRTTRARFPSRPKLALSGKLSASVENAAQNVVSSCDHPEADDSAEESQDEDLGPPVSGVCRRRNSRQQIVEHLRELIPDAGQDDVRARRRPDHVSDLFHTPRITLGIEGRIGQEL
jgi:hypothetical protein